MGYPEYAWADFVGATPVTDTTQTIEMLEGNDHVYRVTDVSVGEHTVLSVQFNAQVLPNQFRKSERFRIGEVWVGTIPSWYFRKYGERFAMRHGFGTPAIAAQVWVAQ